MELFEINMLEVIQKHEYISQRDLSRKVGISLGMVNLLLKKFVKTGLIKVEKLSGNKVKYMLTPIGFSTLSKKTMDYIARSYQAVVKIQNHILSVINLNFTPDEVILIYGKHDEVCAILLDLLENHGYAYAFIDEPNENSKFIQWQDAGSDGIFILKMV